MFGLGTPELLIIAGVVILLFGASALPKFARSIGQAKKEFEKGVNDGEKETAKDKDAEA
jgi:sec-independent protein translocase protein TatA